MRPTVWLWSWALPLLLQAPSSVSSDASRPVARIAGVEPSSGIAYVLLSVHGTGAAAGVGPPPRLTAQCTRDSRGKLRFELLVDFGGVSEIHFAAPWKASAGDLFPPHLAPAGMTMEFLGYVKVKPVKRLWLALQEPAGEWRYGTPGLDSSNMESISFYLQYLKALPTLRLTLPGSPTAEFQTTDWQKAVQAEPVCAASAL